MDKIGIICEYNPFHNGHLYHINIIKKMYPNSLIVLVMSSNYTQRGNLSIINKYNKTRLALDNNIDLVVELPFIFSTQSADIFAKGAINILNKLKVNKLIFGSESNDIDNLINLAKIQVNNKEYDKLVKNYLKQGVNYPTAMSKALKDINKSTITEPNDLLGLSYIKEILRINSNIEPITIKRTNDFHNKELSNNIVSASAIRDAINNNMNINNYVPNTVSDLIINDINYFNYLKYKILTEQNNINIYQTVDEGIENRILKYINQSNTIDELIKNIKTKRYTYNKLSRMFIHILNSFTKEEAINININYIRVLGFNKNGQKHLNTIKKDINIPIITNDKNYKDLLKIDLRSEEIYNLITNQMKENLPIIK